MAQSIVPNAYDLTRRAESVPAAVRTWTEVSREYTGTIAQRHEVSRIILGLTWVPISKNMSVPAMQGAAIWEGIKHLRIPNVAAIAWDGIYMDRFALLGIEGNYTNGRARIFALDTGIEVVVLASDLWDTETGLFVG